MVAGGNSEALAHDAPEEREHDHADALVALLAGGVEGRVVAARLEEQVVHDVGAEITLGGEAKALRLHRTGSGRAVLGTVSYTHLTLPTNREV